MELEKHTAVFNSSSTTLKKLYNPEMLSVSNFCSVHLSKNSEFYVKITSCKFSPCF